MSDFQLRPNWRSKLAHEPDGLAWIALAGELDAAVAPGFRAQLFSALAESTGVILDLRGMVFMDSSGIHVLAAADARARDWIPLR